MKFINLGRDVELFYNGKPFIIKNGENEIEDDAAIFFISKSKGKFCLSVKEEEPETAKPQEVKLEDKVIEDFDNVVKKNVKKVFGKKVTKKFKK